MTSQERCSGQNSSGCVPVCRREPIPQAGLLSTDRLLPREALGWHPRTGFWDGSHLQVRLTVPQLFSKTHSLCWTLFSFWESRIWVHGRQRIPTCLTNTNQKPGHWVSKEHPWSTHFTCCHNSLLGGFKHILGWLHWGKALEAGAWFPPDVGLYAPLSFASVVWCPFALISHGQEYICGALWALQETHGA